jgi:hypothetical protein
MNMISKTISTPIALQRQRPPKPQNLSFKPLSDRSPNIPPNYKKVQDIMTRTNPERASREFKKELMKDLIRIKEIPPNNKAIKRMQRCKSKKISRYRIINYLRHKFTNYDNIRHALEYAGFDHYDLTIVLYIEINKLLCQKMNIPYGFHTELMSEIKSAKYHNFIRENPNNFKLLL